MTKFADKSFSNLPPGSDHYRSEHERIFGPSQMERRRMAEEAAEKARATKICGRCASTDVAPTQIGELICNLCGHLTPPPPNKNLPPGTCPSCEGEGKLRGGLVTFACAKCNGTGKVDPKTGEALP